MTQDPAVVPPDPAPAAVLAIGGSADADDVAAHLVGGRLVPARDGRRPLLVYTAPDAAVRDVTRYLRARALTFVRFGLHVGDLPHDAERLAGPVVDIALRLADRAAPRELWVSAAVRHLTAGSPVALEPVDDLTYRVRLA
ncbi:hypothetical protein Drose_30135 [Dactylosporangium roseum]|uniref:Uncharacterized protein n=1 Tax=Dactylosporangium roseum TaxID=47989 RepID=A0ABY5Z013_9ACTN|nr:hypothetical protein [Dactylosporangium roseum]UWZ35361.1 hypothetical protein Drose_30135 [Dactylosporangium roseum]